MYLKPRGEYLGSWLPLDNKLNNACLFDPLILKR
jgi:hypothetical protein